MSSLQEFRWGENNFPINDEWTTRSDLFQGYEIDLEVLNNQLAETV